MYFLHRNLESFLLSFRIECAPVYTDIDEQALFLPGIGVSVFLGVFWVVVEREEKSKRNAGNYKQRNMFSTPLWLVCCLLLTISAFLKDFCMFSAHLSMVGFRESLLVQVKPKYLNDLTTLIFCPSIVIFIRGIVTCEKKIRATVLPTFIGCFHFRAYSQI